MANSKTKKLPKNKKQKILTIVIITASIIAFFICAYLIFIFSNIPFIAYWRGIWIETAMTTGDHQWLATSFIPRDIIDEVMEDQLPKDGSSGGLQYLETKPPVINDDEIESELPDKPLLPADILNQHNIKVGDTDYAGYKILVNDIEQGIVISEITGTGYKGKIMLIDDPSRLFLATTPYKDVEGLRIKDMMEYYDDAVAGINASGFSDPEGLGTGGDVIGRTCSQGDYWGYYVNYYGSVVITNTDKLVVGDISEVWENYDIRDGIQFGPVLLADGVKIAEGSNGYGIQPRTAIGQREDGVIAFIVIDGRNVLHSVGCTVGELADILLKYDIVNAACCDGGSSSILAYDGEVITKNSSANPTLGRRLPNAFLIKRK